MNKSKYTVTHTYTLCESVCAHFFVWEITFSTACTNFTKCCCWSFFLCVARISVTVFFLRWAALFLCQIIAIITWNMETLRFAYKFISAGLLGCRLGDCSEQNNNNDNNKSDNDATMVEELNDWRTGHSSTSFNSFSTSHTRSVFLLAFWDRIS